MKFERFEEILKEFGKMNELKRKIEVLNGQFKELSKQFYETNDILQKI